MFYWKEGLEFEWQAIEAISLVLSNHYHLLEFLFDCEEAILRRSPEELLKESQCFSSGERVLVRVALDLWSGSGHTKLSELLDSLDQSNFSNVLIGLEYLGVNSRGGGTRPAAN